MKKYICIFEQLFKNFKLNSNTRTSYLRLMGFKFSRGSLGGLVSRSLSVLSDLCCPLPARCVPNDTLFSLRETTSPIGHSLLGLSISMTWLLLPWLSRSDVLPLSFHVELSDTDKCWCPFALTGEMVRFSCYLSAFFFHLFKLTSSAFRWQCEPLINSFSAC